MRRAIILALIVVAAACGDTGVSGDDNTNNDRVLRGERNEYIEVFKTEGNGDKNYLYTITEFEGELGRRCIVVTGASETAIALDCDGLEGNG